MTVRAALALLLMTCACSSARAQAEAPERKHEVLSKVYTVDKKYRSMQGPQSFQDLALLPGQPPELLWITSYSAVVVDAEGKQQLPQEFMCHSNLNFDVLKHRERFGWTKTASNRLFTLSQGQLEIHFPAGFGIPVMSDEQLNLNTQVLNLNVEGEPFQVRHRVTVGLHCRDQTSLVE